eukprot:8816505-Alexandrium_andersonii.AAC.1
MSASLVGSEMCIRDRARLGAECRPHLGGRGVASWVGGRPSFFGGRLEPVSYTHLTLPTICSV